MSATNPDDLLQTFFRAFNTHDLNAVMALYEPEPTMATEPGQLAQGRVAVRQALTGFLAMKPTLTAEKFKVITANDLALSIIKWTLIGTDPDGGPLHLNGTSTDVMRKQPNGQWLFAIDNPWGADFLG